MAISSIPSDIFRKAEETDIERIWQIIGQAKAQMQRLGSQQWDENYPAIEHIRQDIQDGNGYVICREDRVVAYGVISFDGEPVYKDIEGKWSNDLPYVIVHRLAIADEMKRQGMAKQFMLQAEEVSRKKGVYNFRVDTKYDNAYMLRLIDTLGFKYCGEVYYRNNSARKAFEKTIRPYSHPIGISDYTIREATFEDATLIFEAIDKNREDLRIWLPFVDFFTIDEICILYDAYFFFGHFSDNTDTKSRSREWLTEYKLLRKSKFKTCLADFIFEEITKWFNDFFEINILRKSSYVVMRLDHC